MGSPGSWNGVPGSDPAVGRKGCWRQESPRGPSDGILQRYAEVFRRTQMRLNKAARTADATRVARRGSLFSLFDSVAFTMQTE